ncbi:hypothetical protein KQX54_010361 [Cotesia glomerata]|uniref:Uncharacterized protein n=1 Tax=Cotesia glomerata TaxID=32391 RepID=A0AAV7HXG6_COTGL|nr:hypothetical protein KQX54_010361 [Cotesia glomerata]
MEISPSKEIITEAESSIVANLVNNGHPNPDPKMFAQVYRLASSFFLISPPRGCNVSGKDLLRSLIEAKHVLTTSDTQGKDSWLENIDETLQSPQPLDESSSIDVDHDYNQAVTSDAVQSYIAGYIVRKLRKTIKCQICLEAIETHAEVVNNYNRMMLSIKWTYMVDCGLQVINYSI